MEEASEGLSYLAVLKIARTLMDAKMSPNAVVVVDDYIARATAWVDTLADLSEITDQLQAAQAELERLKGEREGLARRVGELEHVLEIALRFAEDHGLAATDNIHRLTAVEMGRRALHPSKES